MKRIVVFASGSGSNFQSILDHCASGDIQAKVVGLVASKEGIGAIERAHQFEVDVAVLNKKEYPSTETYTQQLLQIVNKWEADLIVLAGFLTQIPSELVQAYPNKIINIHPSLLPKFGGKGFYGMNVHRAVVKDGEKESGCTVHFVNEFYDEGAIIEQRKVPVYETDSPEDVAARVLKQEHQLLPAVIKKLLSTTT